MNGTALAASVIVWACAVLCAPDCSADPADPSGPSGPTTDQVQLPVVSDPGAEGLANSEQPDNPAATACRQFDAALNVAAVNYEDFAYATAGSGDFVDYQDPNVKQSNVIGRTALRTAAATAMAAAGTPGLPPAVADPMRSWSLGATKLMVIMGLRGGGDSLNSAANRLNSDAHEAMLACAANGGRG